MASRSARSSGAAVPVVPLTRVDQNVAAGIVRGIAETRSTTVVIGWDGGRSTVGEIFGSVLDQLLLLTKQMIVVAKLGDPNIVEQITSFANASADFKASLD